jgi:ribokinase
MTGAQEVPDQMPVRTPAESRRRANVCVLGSANMDLVVTVDRVPKPSETVTGRHFAQIPGGKGANQALAAARAGGVVRMIGAVGRDEFGQRIRAALDTDGIDTTGLLVADEPTGTAHIVVDAAGENSIVVVRGANGSVRTLTDDHREVIRTSDVLLLQLELPIEVVNEAAIWAAEHGVRVVLTPAPVAPLPGDLLAAVDLLVPNEHEAALLTGGLDARDAAQRLRSRGVDAVAVTMGRRGCLYADGEGVVEVPALDVVAIDTTAAGDTFVAAFTVALAEGRPVRESLDWATAAAAISVQRAGASTSMPYRPEIDALLASS